MAWSCLRADHVPTDLAGFVAAGSGPPRGLASSSSSYNTPAHVPWAGVDCGPQFAGGQSSRAEGPSPLGLLSLRDRYILRRADALMDRAFEPGTFGPMDFQSEEAMMQAAIAASLKEAPTESRGGDRTDGTRSLEEAGIKTPDTSRKSGKKKRGGRNP